MHGGCTLLTISVNDVAADNALAGLPQYCAGLSTHTIRDMVAVHTTVRKYVSEHLEQQWYPRAACATPTYATTLRRTASAGCSSSAARVRPRLRARGRRRRGRLRGYVGGWASGLRMGRTHARWGIGGADALRRLGAEGPVYGLLI